MRIIITLTGMKSQEPADTDMGDVVRQHNLLFSPQFAIKAVPLKREEA